MKIKLYSNNPNYNTIDEIVNCIENGGIIIYPTSTGYAYGCHALQLRSIERICEIKKINVKKKSLSIMFANLRDVSEYCKMNDKVFKFIKDHDTGNYTFILPSASTLPKIFKNRKEVGVRLAQHPVSKIILEELGVPLITSSILYDEYEPEYAMNPSLIEEKYSNDVDLIIDGGNVDLSPSTIIDCTKNPFEIVRYGSGRIDENEIML